MVVHQMAVQAGLRWRLYAQLEPHARTRPGLSILNIAVVVLVVISFVLFALETEPELPAGLRAQLGWANWVVLSLFAIEYLLRLWTCGEDKRHRGIAGRLRYALSFYELADLAAFLPEMIWLSFPHTEDDPMVMFLRVLRLVRLVKIARFVPAFEVLGAAIRRARNQLFAAMGLAFALVFIAAVLMYMVEGVGAGRPEFASIPRSLWWSIATLTTVGYGDVYPVTALGKVAAAVVLVAGVGVVALPTGIFASAFSDELREREQARLALLREIRDDIEEVQAELEDAEAGGDGEPELADSGRGGP